MVCLPCFIIPAFLWFYYKFIRPYMGPVFAKAEEWLAPIKAKWCPQCSLTGTCPIKKSTKASTEGLVKDKSKKSDNVQPSAPADEENEEIDSEEKLEKVIQTGGFGVDLRRRPEAAVNQDDTGTLVRSAV